MTSEAGSLSSRARWLTLVAMTLANSMILVDQTAVPLAVPSTIAALDGSLSISQWILTANVLPLAAFMVFGGRLGDQFGLRRIFLIGAVLFIVSSALAGAAQDMTWLITVRATQGFGAALMMPTTMAIVTAVFPESSRGRALGLMAGASAFFAALGPVLGGLLTQYIDWRAVFLINVPLAAITIILTLTTTPALRRSSGARRRFDIPGTLTFAVGIGGLTVGLGQSQDWGWTSPLTLASLAVGVLSLAAFVPVELRQSDPLIRFGLFRHMNFTAANVSQALAGSIELATAYLLPFFLLLVVGLSPGSAGLALIPATLPIIVVAPLIGRWFDRSGGRLPLSLGFLVLACSSFSLVAAFPSESLLPLIPGFVLQGIGLGIVLTANDPTGLGSVPDDDQGQASGAIDTSEQFGGAIGIAVFTVVLLNIYYGRLFDLLGERGITPTPSQMQQGREFVLRAEQSGIKQVNPPAALRRFFEEFEAAHVYAYQLTFALMGIVAIVGAVVCWLLVRRDDRIADTTVFSRRSRWIWATVGGGPGVSRKPLPDTKHQDSDSKS